MAQFEKQLFNKRTKEKKKKICMTVLHAHAQYIHIVNAKYQKRSVKARVQVDFPVYAQAKSLFKSKQEKWLISQSCYFVKKKFGASNFFMQMFNESILCRQSIVLFRHKLWYKVKAPHMHYLYTCHPKLLSKISSHFAKK